jgi:hypothetical protein
LKSFFHKFSKKKIFLAALVLASLFFLALLTIAASHIKTSLRDQRAAERWSSEGGFAQVSCFFADSTYLTHDSIMEFRSKIVKGLRDASLVAEKEGARDYIDAFCASGSVSLTSDKRTVNVNALGVGGDFFLFHPLELVSGTYFSGSDLMQDGIVIDEETAWQLFGASDVAGLTVTINGVLHFVKGVVKKDSGRMWEGAGLTDSIAYISYDSLLKYGSTSGINCYEVVMPSPVSGFAYRLVQEGFGYSENEMVVVDNSARYGWEGLVKVLASIGLRSMLLLNSI